MGQGWDGLTPTVFTKELFMQLQSQAVLRHFGANAVLKAGEGGGGYGDRKQCFWC